ncbi:unnamed protein product [Orchesella dallaii]|uniref:Uncharacterized protein n=1 Tax=Orchesella dallaii TaxID=48710 RepID=A0ABP1PMD9_9HEXA
MFGITFSDCLLILLSQAIGARVALYYDRKSRNFTTNSDNNRSSISLNAVFNLAFAILAPCVFSRFLLPFLYVFLWPITILVGLACEWIWTSLYLIWLKTKMTLLVLPFYGAYQFLKSDDNAVQVPAPAGTQPFVEKSLVKEESLEDTTMSEEIVAIQKVAIKGVYESPHSDSEVSSDSESDEDDGAVAVNNYTTEYL